MYEWTGELLSYGGVLTLLGPVVAIVLALVTKRVIPSLLLAALVEAFVAAKGSLTDFSVLTGQTVSDVLVSPDNLMITAFSLSVAATVGIMGRSGGTRALISAVEATASGRRGTMLTTWVSGAVIFFDDYANCLVVGSALGPLCDRYRVSRAKLAYIVDATAAPVASLAVVSTWVGYEVGLFAPSLTAAGIDTSAFSIFLSALPYRFYCIFTIVFVGAIAFTGKDFGPMADEERRVRAKPLPVSDDDPTGTYWWLAALPVTVLVLTTLGLLYQTGASALGDAAADARLFEILDKSDPYRSMLTGGLVALAVASLASVLARTLSPGEVVRGAAGSMAAVLEALAVLYLAWILGGLIEEAGTGAFLISMLGDRIVPWVLPAITFLLAAGTAFSVGSSFFTMGALIPLVLPLALSLEGGVVGPVVLASCAAVLDGAVLGDHASPISDTTILSALGATVDVVLHVQTQLPYVLVVGGIAVVCGSLPVGLGMPVWVSLIAGSATAIFVVVALGQSTDPADGRAKVYP